MKKTTKYVGLGASLLAATGLAVGILSLPTAPVENKTDTVSFSEIQKFVAEVEDSVQPVETPAAIDPAAPVAPVETPVAPPAVEPAPEPEPEPEPPVKCPEGQTPGMVDEYGNESNCAVPCAMIIVNEDGTETCIPYEAGRYRDYAEVVA